MVQQAELKKNQKYIKNASQLPEGKTFKQLKLLLHTGKYQNDFPCNIYLRLFSTTRYLMKAFKLYKESFKTTKKKSVFF